MTRKNTRADPLKTPTSPRIARPPSAARPQRAHALLLHGFLVTLARKPAGTGGSAKRTIVGAAKIGVRVQRPPFDTKREAPADDATFH